VRNLGIKRRALIPRLKVFEVLKGGNMNHRSTTRAAAKALTFTASFTLAMGLSSALADEAANKPKQFPQNAYFGDTHVHTGWSADAGLDGAVKSPEDAYRFAKGEEVKSNTGLKAKLHRSYDWFMVTDHSDAMGVVNEIVAGNPRCSPTRCSRDGTKRSTPTARNAPPRQRASSS
jgi:isopentenyl diphosphate isomerase/L-lactate dehydrogenase-like FMN-dependent dehydrogenase